MNILQLQDQLKGLSQDQLVREMQMPSGSAPQYLVLSELTRRKKMAADMASQQQSGPQRTVAEEAIAAAGVPQAGLGRMAMAMAPQTDMMQNTGVGQMLPPGMPSEAPVMGMADGGYVRKMAPGGLVVRNGRLFMEGPNGELIPADADGRAGTAAMMSGLGDPNQFMRDALIEAAMQRENARPVGRDFTPVNPSYTEDRPDRFNAYPVPPMGREAASLIPPPPRSIADLAFGLPLSPQDASLTDQVRNSTLPQAAFLGTFRPMEPSALDALLAESAAAPQGLTLEQLDALGPANNYGPSFERGGRGPAGLREIALGPDFEQVGREFGQASPMEMADAARVRTAPSPFELEAERLREGTVGALDRVALDADTARMAAALGPGAGSPGMYATPEALDRMRLEASKDEGMALPPPPGEPGVLDAIWDWATSGPGVRMATTEEDIAAAKAAREATEEAAKETTEEKPDEPLVAPPGGPEGPRGPGGGGAGGSAAAGMSSYEQEIMEAIERSEQRATQDKWLALAQAGMEIMSAASRQGTFAGAVGEGGAKGLSAFRQGRDEAENSRLALLKELEGSRMARAQLAARGGGGGGRPVDPLKVIGDATDLLTRAQEMRLLAGDNADLAGQAQMLEDLANSMLAPFISGGGGGTVPVR
jgi:hypothetical protein